MITLFYVSATLLQSRRINNVCHKIGEQLGQKGSITFYSLPAKTDDGFAVNLATSELCLNRNAAKVTEILWLLGNRRGCSLAPAQCVHITPWITFPESPSWLPFAYQQTANIVLERLKCHKNVLHLLLETDIQPSQCSELGNLEEVVKLENYGKLIAWKMDSHLALIMQTDVEYFTKLLIATFLQNNFLVNDQLPLLRIESVLPNGTPQPFEELRKHLKKPTRSSAYVDKAAWTKHLDGLRALSVLASQATEFEYNKNRTEGKTGLVVKPDLIPHEMKLKKEKSSGEPTPQHTPLKSPSKAKDTPSKQLNAAVSALSAAEHANQLLTAEVKATTSQMTAKATTATHAPTNKPSTDAAAVSEQVAPTVKPSPSKPNTKLSSPSKHASQLEKLAAASAAAALQKSPQHATTTPKMTATSDTATSSSNKSSALTATVDSITQNNAAMPKQQTEPMRAAAPTTNTPVSAQQHNAQRPSLKRSKDSIKECNPLNILVYSDISSARDSAIATLRAILEPNMYTIYALTAQQVVTKQWIENTALLVVCGAVASSIGEILVDYFLHGGKVLSLCSDILHFILPNYRTAEVREHELVQFSYDKWQKVKMMHHIFCYQPSPVKKHFSTESEDSQQSNSRKSALVCPRSIELKDLHGKSYNLDVQVLGSEEIWKTPSLLFAKSRQSGGKAVFSQVHLETSPSQFETDESRYAILKQNEKIRLEIFADLLGKHLEVTVKSNAADSAECDKCIYEHAYFLGRHECKFELLEKLKPKMVNENVITTAQLTMKFCGKNDAPPKANANMLPILIHSCPEDFSTVDYFEQLKTVHIGRLLIYAPIVNSTMNVINQLELTHGIAVLARQQTDGVGRSNNQWLSPLGCAMFSIQLHITLSSPLGARLPLVQHLVAVSMINCLKSHPTYQHLDIGLKWPNDIYAHGLNKIGGLIVTTTLIGGQAITNIGCGINLDNSKPTTCINDMIRDYNKHQADAAKLPLLKYEQFIALIFNELERLVDQVQNGNFEDFYQLYYELWLHKDQAIQITDNAGSMKDAVVVGIDDFGYLKVKLANGKIETVQPDGNSFDMLKGLIVPKYN